MLALLLLFPFRIIRLGFFYVWNNWWEEVDRMCTVVGAEGVIHRPETWITQLIIISMLKVINSLYIIKLREPDWFVFCETTLYTVFIGYNFSFLCCQAILNAVWEQLILVPCIIFWWYKENIDYFPSYYH